MSSWCICIHYPYSIFPIKLLIKKGLWAMQHKSISGNFGLLGDLLDAFKGYWSLELCLLLLVQAVILERWNSCIELRKILLIRLLSLSTFSRFHWPTWLRSQSRATDKCDDLLLIFEFSRFELCLNYLIGSKPMKIV